jgi:ribosomal protein S18 acetylase RimI-like enzyme
MTQLSAVQFRPARSTDIPALCNLLEALFTLETDFHPDRHKQAQALQLLIDKTDANSQPACLVWVAEQDGEVVGMCSVQVFISTAEGGEVGLVEDVIIDAAHRNQAIGQRLLSSLEAWARERGLTRLQLLADAHNFSAISFYEKQNWSRTQLLAMRKSIKL